jgi:hypothetical protein
MNMGKREGLPILRVYASPRARWVRTNRQSLKSSLSEMRKSGTLLTFKPTRLRPAYLGVTQPSPLVSSAFLPKARLLSKSTPGVRHYAAIPLMPSMELGRKSEVQSKRFSQPSYCGPHARGIEASNHWADSEGQANDGDHRRSCVSTKERGRGFQARHTRTTTEARKEQNPPEKIKLGHYPILGWVRA